MRHLLTSVSVCALAWLAGNGAVRAAAPAEYHQTDTSFYLPAAVLKAEPNAVILTPAEFTQKGDSYFVTLKRHRMPAAVYLEQTKDWLEPITPPSMPASLGVAPDAMQIRVPQGDVQVAPPNSNVFASTTEGAPLVNGATIKTGNDGSAVVLFGGVNSVRIAPNSEAMVQQTIQPALRSTRVDLKSGICFSKVGLRPGEKQDYEVHTPFGVAAAKGTDFVCVALPDRTDVWIAAGTVQFTQPSGEVVGTVKAVKNGLRIIRFPAVTDPAQANTDTAQTMTTALNFIPTVNNNLKTLRQQMAQGVKATPQELRWMTYLKTVHALIKLSLVAPPPPPPPPVVPVAPVPLTKPGTKGASSMPGPERERIRFSSTPEPPPTMTTNGAGMPMPMLHASLSPRAMSLDQPLEPVPKKKLAKKKKLRAQPVVIASNTPPPEALVPVPSMPPPAPAPMTNAPAILPPKPLAAEKSTEPIATKPATVATTTAMTPAAKAKAKKKLASKKKKPAPTLAAAAATKEPASATTPKTAVIMPPAKPKPTPKAKAVVARVKKPLPKPAPKPVVAAPKAEPALKAEIATMPVAPAPAPATPPPDHALIVVAGDGSIHFEGKQLSAGRLERRLSEISKIAPDCNVVIRGDRDAQPGRMGTVVAMCHQANLHNVSIEPVGGGAPVSTAPGDTQP